MAYHLALSQVRKRNIYETLWFLSVLCYHSRSVSSIGSPSPSVLTLSAGDLSVPPLDESSLRFIILFGSSISFTFMTVGFPFLPFSSYFCFPFGLCWVRASVVNFLNHGLVAFQPSVTSEDFSAQHFLLFRVIMGQEQTGHERADVCATEKLVVGALPTPAWSQAGAWHDTQHFFILGF